MREGTPVRRRVRGVLAAGVALAALLVVAGCGASTLPDAGTPAAPPRPVGVQDPAKIPGADSQDTSCAADSYRPHGSPADMLHGPAVSRIRKRGRLVVGVDQNTYLFGFRDQNNDLQGFDIDMLREVARAIFGDPDKIQFKVITSAQRIPVLRKHQVDLVADVMTVNCERWKQVAFSSVYFDAGQRVLVPSGSTASKLGDLGGKKVCAAKGSTSIRAIAADPAKPVPVAVDDWTDCLVMLQQRQVAAISTDDTILAGLKKQDPNTKVIGPKFTDEPYGIAANLDDVDLVRFVNGVLAKIRGDGTWKKLYDQWLTVLGPAPKPPAAQYRD
ncbi:ABC transporter substrate-binding protein [Actinocatenispora thailandica]|uniref:ABC transporter substrate-binding protein n=2 Tax=Actinocatenispora thailandica TaxID=227318 RepID=A0A7R7DN69_9ACTN|nr:ABC transporter substrate-binding protein [Actinocatenispora thailandica]